MSALRELFDRFSHFPQSVPPSATAPNRKPIRITCADALAFKSRPGLSGSGRPLKWYFAHASVGSNLIDGFHDLNAEDPNTFPYTTAASTGTFPTETVPATIYEHNRGNPGWKPKIDRFAAAVQNGWRFPKVDVVLNKLCYIDQFASANYYLQSMSRLEAAFPETIFIYATMPLTSAADWKSRLRQSFNNKVRDWTQANRRILFDLADIESHNANGNACTFNAGSKSFELLCGDYTDDGGHLNRVGRRILAQGFYGLAAALEQRALPAQSTEIAAEYAALQTLRES
jgi:hypothetical protein